MAWNPNIPTVTNRVQDDLNALRENFQHLDPLAQAVGELQTVSGLAPVAGELQAVSELAPYAQALLDSRIVEMGSNGNGTYVRWENGLQVCAFMHPDGISVGPGNYAYYDWTPPAQFVEFYAVLMVPRTLGGDLSTVSLTYGVLRMEQLTAVLRNNADITRTMFPQFVAIGRWK